MIEHKHDPDSLCNCGTLEEAIEAAKRLYIQMAGTDCKIWAMQVSSALRTIAIESIVDEDLDRKKCQVAVNIVVERTKETIDFRTLEAEALEHRKKLYS